MDIVEIIVIERKEKTTLSQRRSDGWAGTKRPPSGRRAGSRIDSDTFISKDILLTWAG